MSLIADLGSEIAHAVHNGVTSVRHNANQLSTKRAKRLADR